MATLLYQWDCIWDHFQEASLGVSVKMFPERFSGAGMIHFDTGNHHFMGWDLDGIEEKEKEMCWLVFFFFLST